METGATKKDVLELAMETIMKSKPKTKYLFMYKDNKWIKYRLFKHFKIKIWRDSDT